MQSVGVRPVAKSSIFDLVCISVAGLVLKLARSQVPALFMVRSPGFYIKLVTDAAPHLSQVDVFFKRRVKRQIVADQVDSAIVTLEVQEHSIASDRE